MSNAEVVLGAGRGAMITAFFAAAWMFWGASFVDAFPFGGAIVAAIIEIVLIAGAIYLIRKGRLLCKQFPPSPGAAATRRSFAIVTITEFVAIAILVNVAFAIKQPELAPVWTAIVVGLHFIPLARIFRAPAYTVLGIVMTLWCVLCWIVLRGNALAAYACFGTAILLWLTSAFAIHRGRQVIRALV